MELFEKKDKFEKIREIEDYWYFKFPEQKRKKSLLGDLNDFIINNNISVKTAKRIIFKFRRIFDNESFIFHKIPKDIISFNKFFITSISQKNKRILEKMEIDLNTDSIFLDIFLGDYEKFKLNFNAPEIIRDKKYSVGSPDWVFQRLAEVIGQTYSLYSEKYKPFEIKSYAPEEYLKDLGMATGRFLEFLYGVDESICVYRHFPNYFYVLERPYCLFDILNKFFEDRFAQKKLYLLWIGNNVFNSQFIEFLEENNFFFQEETMYSRYFYRKIAKKTGFLYRGNIGDLQKTLVFKNAIKKKSEILDSS